MATAESFAEYVLHQLGVPGTGSMSSESEHQELRTLVNSFFFERNRDLHSPTLTRELLEEYMKQYFGRDWDSADAIVRANTVEHRAFSGGDPLVSGGGERSSSGLLHIEKQRLEQDRRNQVSQVLRSLGCQDNHDHEKICKAPKPRDWDANPPTIIMLGGGIGSGKSSVAKEFSHSEFWTQFGNEAVVVEADQFKLNDPLFNVLTKHLSFQEASMTVHSNSIHSANMLLLSALKYKRDVLLDGTMKWAEFVFQTLAMMRRCHERDYEVGKGYIGEGDEEYWREVGPRTEPSPELVLPNHPYRIWVVAVTAKPQVSIQRCIRRAVLTSRSVSMYQLLRSHRLFSSCFVEYCQLVDAAYLYDNTEFRCSHSSPKLIACKLSLQQDVDVLDSHAYSTFQSYAGINDHAASSSQLFKICD